MTPPGRPPAFDHFARLVELPDALEMFAARAQSEVGRRLARSLRPLARASDARARLGEVEEARRILDEGGRLPLAGIADAAGLVEAAHARGRPLEPAELTAVADACGAGRELRRAVSALPGPHFPRLRALVAKLPGLDDLETSIRTAIDGERVRDTASRRLAEIREAMEAIAAELDRKVEAVLESRAIKPYLQSPKPTLRGGRYVLAVRAEHRHKVHGILHGRSQTGSTVFIEPDEIVDLGNDLSDLSFKERDEVTRILRELARECFAARAALDDLTRGLARADVAVACARAARELDLHAPEVADDGPLVLENARHPLLLRQRAEGKIAEVVPLSAHLGERWDILVITGPNTGGKTVALKTVGLLAALALSGLPIPADATSRMPVFGSFFADIGDEQAIEASLSTFSGHVAEIIEILGAADARSLVLIDELGAGTDPEEGSALGAAVLEALLARGARGIVTTHLGALKAFAYSRPRVENASVEFDAETLRPTYRLAIGVPGASHALAIAERLGMPADVVARAAEIRGQRGVGETELLGVVQRLRIEAEEDRAAARRLLEEAARARDAAEAERRRAEAERRAIAAEADDATRELWGTLKAALAAARERAKNLPASAQALFEALEADLLGALEHTPFVERRRAFARTLQKGARVYVVSFGREGVVTRINKSRERATVRMGDAQVEVGFDELSGIGAPPRGHGGITYPDEQERWV